MKTFYTLLIWIFSIFIIIALLCGYISAKRGFLIAQENLIVDSYPIPDPTRFPSVGNLELGEKVRVLSCDDLKSYTAIHVQLKNGQEGYIIEGKFRLELFPFWSSIDSPVSFSCPPA
jgi:hypothetical protein